MIDVEADHHPNSSEVSSMNVFLKKESERLQPWKVLSIIKRPERKGIEVTFTTDGRVSFRFQMIEFGIGRRGAKAAALAKFAASAGFGDARDIYRFVAGLPRTMTGVIFAEGTPIPGLEAPGNALP